MIVGGCVIFWGKSHMVGLLYMSSLMRPSFLVGKHLSTPPLFMICQRGGGLCKVFGYVRIGLTKVMSPKRTRVRSDDTRQPLGTVSPKRTRIRFGDKVTGFWVSQQPMWICFGTTWKLPDQLSPKRTRVRSGDARHLSQQVVTKTYGRTFW